jgi:hypothetical protein
MVRGGVGWGKGMIDYAMNMKLEACLRIYNKQQIKD